MSGYRTVTRIVRACASAAAGLALLAHALPLGAQPAPAAAASPAAGAAEAPAGGGSAWVPDYSLRGSTWSSDRELTRDPPVGAGTLWLRMQPGLSSRMTLKLEGWISSQPALRNADTPGELRDGYVAWLGESLEVRAGRQVVAWGRADALNPTDNLGARNFRLLFPNDDEQRLGTGMVQASYPVLGTVVSLYWIPEFRANVYPVPPLPPGVLLRPDRQPENTGQGALRIDRSGGAVDWSVSYYDGLDHAGDLALDSVSAQGAVVQRRFHRVRVAGADAATTLGRFGLRAEVAHTWSEDPDGTDPGIKNDFLYAVAGADRTFFQYLNVNVQYIYRETSRWTDPLAIANPMTRALALQNAVTSFQRRRVENGASLRVSNQWLNETLETEVAGVWFFQDEGSVVQPKIVYKATDTLRITAGAQVFSGPDGSFFGMQKDNSTSYLEVRWGY